MLACALDCDLTDVTCLATCASQGCADAQTALENFLDCAFEGVVGGPCMGDCLDGLGGGEGGGGGGVGGECQECLLDECAAEAAACLGTRC
jgi:hypothetical protein